VLNLARALLTTAAVLAAAPAPAAAAWTWPLAGAVITPYANGADPYAAGRHRGIDVAGPPGAPVVAATAGTVRFAGTVGSSGTTVSVRSADGRLDLSYLHLSALAVRRGQAVAAGTPIGTVGTTGRRSAGPAHLHFGVRRAGTRHEYLDPLALLPPPPAARSAPRPVGAPAPLPVPTAPSRGPAPAPRAFRPAPVPAARRVRIPSLRPAAPAPSAGRRHGRPAPDTAPAPDPLRLGPAPHAAGLPARPHPGPARPARPAAGGAPDPGWLAACAGLTGAALLLLGGRRRRARRSGGVRGRASSIALRWPTTSRRRSTT
jgi:murein DD-endopeptidase MepM/ murein hydrolase activator NlpD